MKHNHDIERHIKKSLEEYYAQPRLSSFDEVMKKLERKKRRRFFFILLLGGVLLITGFSTWYLTPSDKIYLVREEKKTNELSVDESAIQGSESPLQQERITGGTIKENLPAQEKELPKPRQTPHRSRYAAIPASVAGNGKTEQIAKVIDQSQNPPQAEAPIVKNEVEEKDPPGEEIEQLTPINIVLPFETKVKEPHIAITEITDTAKIRKKKSTVVFCRGLSFDPQMSTYLLSENKRSSIDPFFKQFYLTNRRNQNKMDFNFALGVKGAVVVNDKWEFQSGIGVQFFRYSERVFPLPGPSTSNYSSGSGIQYQTQKRGFVWNNQSSIVYDQEYRNRFCYAWHTVEAAKYFTLSNFIKIKAGLGLRLNYLFWGRIVNAIGNDEFDDYYYGTPGTANPFLATVNLKMGYVENIGKRMQVQFCPNVFCSPNSMIKQNYAIKQRSIGMGFECLFLYRLN